MTKGSPPSWKILWVLPLAQVQNKALFDEVEDEDEKKGLRRKWRRGLTLELRGLCKGFKSQRLFWIEWFSRAAILFSQRFKQKNSLLKCLSILQKPVSGGGASVGRDVWSVSGEANPGENLITGWSFWVSFYFFGSQKIILKNEGKARRWARFFVRYFFLL